MMGFAVAGFFANARRSSGFQSFGGLLMHSRFIGTAVLCAMLASGSAVVFTQEPARAQTDASPVQRVEVMRSKLDSMRRSLNSAISAVNSKDSGDKKDKNADDPRARLSGLEREVSSFLSEINDLKGKLDRSERVEISQVDRLETSVAELNTRVEGALQATAGDRKVSVTETSTKKKKKGRFFGLLGGGDDDKYQDLTGTVAAGRDRVLFEEATLQVRKGSHDTGRLLFNTIITTYPDSPYLPLAKLAIADSFYLEGTTSALIQAASTYQDWLTFFPTDPLSDRVMLKMAECEMRQMGLADRDVSRARKAEQRLKVILQQFPDTPLKNDVMQRLNEVQENLGLHGLYVARFYYDRQKNNKGGLKGSQSRLREIIEKYPNFSYLDEVYYMLGSTYVLEEEPDEAAKFFQTVVRDYPNSGYAEKAKEQLQLIGASIPAPDPVKAGLPQPERPSMTQRVLTEVVGTVEVTVDKNGILISKDNKTGDLIDQAIVNKGQITPSTTPDAPVNRRPPARPQQNSAPASPASSGANNQLQPTKP
jgi:outer membrane protein assembly factor BamD